MQDPEAVRAEREAIDQAIEGLTVCHVLARNVERYGSRPAISWKTDDRWVYLTWRGYREQALRVAAGLIDLGLEPGAFVAIMARNRPEHLIADLGAVHAGAVPVSIYNTLAPEQVAYIAQHCEARVAFVDGPDFLERWDKIRPELGALRHLVYIGDPADVAGRDDVIPWRDVTRRGASFLARDPQAVEARWRAVRPEGPATIVYTSGTTGPPKGVIVTHRNVLWTSESANRTGVYADGLRGISYLPLAHSLERIASHYLGMWKAGHVYLCPEVLQVFEVVPEVHPQAFAGVPRVWEKIEAGILKAIGEEPNERRRKIALAALRVAREAGRLEAEGQKLPPGLRIKHALADRVVFSKIRKRLGLERCEIAVSGAAPISKETLEFFWGIGIRIHEGYGLTENTAPATLNVKGKVRLGTVGSPLPGVEVRLGDDGEVLIRGGNVSPGYYRDDAKTAETFDDEGWLHTGDIGEIDEDGFLRIVDRKKELIITAGGKNISPANLESLLKRHPLIGQACAIGDRRPYVSALLVLDGEAVPGWAEANGVTFTDLASFVEEPGVREELQRAVDDANRQVSNVEAVKRWVVLPTEWTAESEELTPTLKLKRRVIHEKYAGEIESLYDGSGSSAR